MYGRHRLLEVVVPDDEVEGLAGGAEGDHLHVHANAGHGREAPAGNSLSPEKSLPHDAHQGHVVDSLQPSVSSGFQRTNGLVSGLEILSG